MARITIVLDDELLEEVDRLSRRRGYQNRSEAIRDLVRGGLGQIAETEDGDHACVAALVYAYNHGERELAKRLVKTFHDHHDLAVSALHVHLDHDTCLEVSVLRGKVGEVNHLAEHIIAERGVRHGQVVIFPAGEKQESHSHGARRHSHSRRAG